MFVVRFSDILTFFAVHKRSIKNMNHLTLEISIYAICLYAHN